MNKNVNEEYDVIVRAIKRQRMEGNSVGDVVNNLVALGMDREVATIIVHNADNELGMDSANEWWTKTSVWIVSHPKCGRTWLQVILGKLLSLENKEFNDGTFVNFQPYCNTELPNIIFSHAGADGGDIYDALDVNKFKSKKKIVLVRNPADMMVSYYFQLTNRINKKDVCYSGEISEFIRDETYGIGRVIYFMNFLEATFNQETDIVMKYEDMSRNIHHEMVRICHHVGFSPNENHVKDAIKFGGFNNMRHLELSGYYDVKNVQRDGDGLPAPKTLTHKNNQESHKVRKGVVGGYTEYLSI